MIRSVLKTLLALFVASAFSNVIAAEKGLVKAMHVKVEGSSQQNLDAFCNKYLNREVDIDAFKNEAVDFFSDNDTLFPLIFISEEKLKKGELDVYVKKTSINEVIIYSDQEEKNPLVLKYIDKILETKPTSLKTFQKYMTLLNRIPGYQVNYEFRPTQKDDAVDLVLTITKFKGDLYLSSDTYGTADLGEIQNVASMQVYSPFGANDLFNVFGVTTNHPDRLYIVGGGYSILINSYGTSVNLSASTSRSNSTYEDYISTKNGVNNFYSLSFNHPLYLDENQTLEAELGASYKTEKSYTADINFKGRPAIYRKLRKENFFTVYSRADTQSNYTVANAALRYFAADKLGGSNIILFNYNKGLNGTFNNYSDPADIVDKKFSSVSIEVSRDQELPKNFSLFTRIMGGTTQVAAPDQELFFLGGRDFGRGYDSGLLSGNDILASSLELRYNRGFEDDKLFSLIQPYVFRDIGYIGKQSSDTNISHLSSYGAGIRFFLNYDADVSVEVAEPVKKLYSIYGEEYKADTNIGIMVTKLFRF